MKKKFTDVRALHCKIKPFSCRESKSDIVRIFSTVKELKMIS